MKGKRHAIITFIIKLVISTKEIKCNVVRAFQLFKGFVNMLKVILGIMQSYEQSI